MKFSYINLESWLHYTHRGLDKLCVPNRINYGLRDYRVAEKVRNWRESPLVIWSI